MTKEVQDVVPEYRYVLEVIQQPKRAKAMAFGERDRRPVDPCPIVQLRVFGPDGVEDKQLLGDNHLIMHAALFDHTGTIDRSVAYSLYDGTITAEKSASISMAEQQSTGVETLRAHRIMDNRAASMPETHTQPATTTTDMLGGDEDNDAVAQQIQTQGEPEQSVTGTLVSAPFHLRDMNDRLGCFYCFPNIRVSHPGKYSLRFSLMRMPSTDPTTTEPEQILESVFSTPFTVYSVRDFPGVDESTALSKKFAHQGVGIPIRNKGRMKADAEDAGNFK